MTPTNKLEEEIGPAMDGELKSEMGESEGSKSFPGLYRSNSLEVPHGFRIQEFQAIVLDASISSSPSFWSVAPRIYSSCSRNLFFS